MPSTSTLALILALGLAVFVVQPPGAAAARVRKVADDDDDDDDDESASSSTSDSVPAAVMEMFSSAVAPEAPSKPKSAPASLLKVLKTSSNASDDDDDDSDSDDDGKDDADDESEDDPEVQRLKKQERLDWSELENITQEIDLNTMKQTKAKAQLADVDDPAAQAASNQEISLAVKAIENETQSQALGGTLGKMWSEMRLYASPFWQEHLSKEINKLGEQENDLEEEQTQLRAKLTKTRSKLDKARGGEQSEQEDAADAKTQAVETEEPAKAKEAPPAADAKEEEDKPARDNETSRMYLGVWCAGMVAFVLAVYFVARQQL